ncbi:hypothetical protein [Flavobacterium notoginsengisoli]|uniref:hypothetical protein n=1 Tax=Flavobacterium notoginsengisoli TaxID=1478199 RepID=UPI00363F26F4
MFKFFNYRTQKIVLTTVAEGTPKEIISRLRQIRLRSFINRIAGNPAYADGSWFLNKDGFNQYSMIVKNENIVKESLKEITPYISYLGEIKNIASFFGWICPKVTYQILCYKRENEIWICWNYTFQIGGILKGLYFLWFMKNRVNVSIEKITCQAFTAFAV